MLDKRTAGDLTKLLIFIVVTTLATGVLVVTIGNLTFGGATSFKAVFADGDELVAEDINVCEISEYTYTSE